MFNHNILAIQDESTNRCIGWGNNTDGQLGFSNTIKGNQIYSIKNVPTKIKHIASGSMHTIIYDEYNNVYGFGNNMFGQLGTNEPNIKSYCIPKLILSYEKIKTIVCGLNFSIIYRENGDILVAGNNNNCQLGFPDKKQRNDFTFLCNDQNVKIIKCGCNYTIAYKYNGDLIGFGSNIYGQLGFAKKLTIISKPRKILNNKNIINIECGHYHTIITTIDGCIYGSGYNCMGQLGTGNIDNNLSGNIHNNSYRFIPIVREQYLRQIVCGGHHTIILDKFGNVYGAGGNTAGQLGLIDRKNYYKFTKITKNNGIRTISAGSTHTILYENNGNIIIFGNNMYGQLGYDTKTPFSVVMHKLANKTDVKIINNTKVGDIYLTPESFCSLDKIKMTEILVFLRIHAIYNKKYTQYTYPLKYTKWKIINFILK
jgi:alpha-tubulin suppressor-like RCC1 family protein